MSWWVFNKKNKAVTEGINVNQLSTEISRGNVAGAQPFSSYGRYVSSGAVANHVVWPDGAYNIPPDIGVQLSIVSTSANDTNTAGTGARTIDIHYLDSNLIPQVETVVLNGLTLVLTVATNIRFIQCVHIVTAGTLAATAGIVTLSNSGITYAQIEAGGRRCASSARMIPAGKKLYVSGAVGGATSGTAAAKVEIKISSSYFDGHDFTHTGIFIPFGSISLQDNTVAYAFPLPAGPFPSGTLVLMETTTDKAATVTGNWFGWLEDA